MLFTHNFAPIIWWPSLAIPIKDLHAQLYLKVATSVPFKRFLVLYKRLPLLFYLWAYLNPGFLEDGAYATGHDVVDVGRRRLGGREGEFPSLVQQQLKAGQQLTRVLLVPFDGVPVEARGRRVQIQADGGLDVGQTKVFVLTLKRSEERANYSFCEHFSQMLHFILGKGSHFFPPRMR